MMCFSQLLAVIKHVSSSLAVALGQAGTGLDGCTKIKLWSHLPYLMTVSDDSLLDYLIN